ncbi:indolepyruvate oxidoreductase subunit beta family protein [Ramlibacter algicola]|uniref:Indolepyruvate oxidoreductase subunit beta family protein n=1 Tax=Ramlibacter algicola TaxID=2795217 RepID=A0A934Q1F7_9BURK|nr:indolepyruvate oxidoreductase subunit beta family protein [Ramlibacter algicola]MBK0392517.1 indolepyruvate oxidoreductase subunit beta family protein [Ramlibacter algicola]
MTRPPLRILVAALGGEGGGTLLDWIVRCAELSGLPVQATSVPGVAQRTGATSYYAELLRDPLPAGSPDPVFALTPVPSMVDVLVASELLEAARMIERGFVDAGTTLIASTHRVYTTIEKMHGTDGRADADRVQSAAAQLAGRSILVDMESLAQRHGTVVSAVMFGALAGAGVLPWPRERCEEVIRLGGRGAQASLAGFAAGFAAASEGAPATAATATRDDVAAVLADAPLRAEDRAALMQRCSALPGQVGVLAAHGALRCLDYQDFAYATTYLDRLEPLVQAAPASAVLEEAARQLALWMCFEDIVRVADLKTRRERFERIRAEARAAAGEVVRITEHFKPGVHEVCDLLPRAAGLRLLRTAHLRGWLGESAHAGMHIRSTSIWGYLLLRTLAKLRPLRRKSLRFHQEDEALQAWLQALAQALRQAPDVAAPLARLPQVLKGYGETQRRGREHYASLWREHVVPALQERGTRDAAAFNQALQAALAQPESARSAVAPAAQPVFWAAPASKR